VLQVGRHDAADEREVRLAARDRAAAAPGVLDLQVHRDLRVPPLEVLCARRAGADIGGRAVGGGKRALLAFGIPRKPTIIYSPCADQQLHFVFKNEPAT